MLLSAGRITEVAVVVAPNGTPFVKQTVGYTMVDGEHRELKYHFHSHFDLGRFKNTRLHALVQHVREIPKEDEAGRPIVLVDIQLPYSA